MDAALVAIYTALAGYYTYSKHSLVNLPTTTISDVAHNVTSKILPIAFLALASLMDSYQAPNKTQRHYCRHVGLGLLASLLGDICLAWRLIIPGACAFGLAHILYIVALQVKPWRRETLVFYILLGCVLLGCIKPWVPSNNVPIQGTVIIYTFVVMAFCWRATDHMITYRVFPAVCACTGALVFTASDFVLAYNLWNSSGGSHFMVMVLYYAAQLLIFLSTKGLKDKALSIPSAWAGPVSDQKNE